MRRLITLAGVPVLDLLDIIAFLEQVLRDRQREQRALIERVLDRVFEVLARNNLFVI